MDEFGGGRGPRMDKAEGGAIVFVEPIGHVFYAVSILDVDVPAVRLGNIIRLEAAQAARGRCSGPRRSGGASCSR